MGREKSACMKTTGDESKIKLVPPVVLNKVYMGRLRPEVKPTILLDII